MTQSTHAFDVFDTCLVSVFLDRSRLSFALAEAMLGDSIQPTLTRRTEVSQLARLRLRAERRTEEASGRDDVGLAAIYAQFSELADWGIAPAHMMATEIELAKASTRPVASTVRRIRDLRQQNANVLFIADSQLPERVIREMLLEGDVAQPEDRIYVSSEEGLTARSGALLQVILERERLEPDQLVLHGDGRVGWAGRRTGVGLELSTETAVTRYEKAVLDEHRMPSSISGRIAGVYRVARLSVTQDSSGWHPDVAPLVAGAVAPLFVAFVAWVLEEARREGMRRLYFVARDGQVLLRIAQQLVGGEDDPELLYLYGSRQAWYLPSVETIDSSGLHFIMDGANSLAPTDNLRKLHIRAPEIRSALERHGLPAETWDRQLDAQEVDRFWDALAEPEVVALISARRDEARDIALEYFSQEGLLDDDRWALVDIGWNLTSQSALKKILAAGGQSHALGFYLAIGYNRTSPQEHGRAVGLLVEELDYGPRYPGRPSIFDNKGLIDQVFTISDHGRTLGYTRSANKVVPVPDTPATDPRQEALRNTIQGTMVTLAGETARTGLARHNVPALVDAGRLVMDLFLEKPTRSEARAIGWFPIIYDHNDVESRTVHLADPITLGTLWRIARTVTRRFARGGRLVADSYSTPTALIKDLSWGFSWLEGSAALSRPPGRLAVRVFKAMMRLVPRRRQLVAGAAVRLSSRLRPRRR